ncbi:hypothetical protein Q7S_25791 (plasmid) [Rahnella aquatilis HX2]|nr:hypothetical protein Q7S_25791 [Rahnella aquatilis HX2]
MWLMKTLLTSGCTNQLGAGHPNSAKTALIDMGFNLGLLRLSRVFTKFNAAVNRKDWAAAAEESHRTKIQESRNVDTRNQLIAASQGK